MEGSGGQELLVMSDDMSVISETSPEPVRKKLKLTLEMNNCCKSKVPTVEEVYEKDLPILCNVDQVHVAHYLMSLQFDFDSKVVKGTLILFPEKLPTKSDNDQEIDMIVLDSCSLQFSKISVLNLVLKDLPTNPVDLYSLLSESHPCQPENNNLEFLVDKWSLSIKLPVLFPSAIKIEYQTMASSPSIQWRPCKGHKFKDMTLCCFTPASPVNNRGLFPCQEDPSAMATWDCFTILNHPFSAFLSSDNPGLIIEAKDEQTTTYFNCSENLPMSTFAFIASQFSPTNIFEIVKSKQSTTSTNDSCHQMEKDVCTLKGQEKESLSCCASFKHECPLIPVRIIFQTVTHFDMSRLSIFVVHLLKATYNVLGKLPFQRLDIILMPDSFPTIGLCNPNMIFLSSPSVLSGDHQLIYSRLTHEIGHFWFGLSIGALDWTEEWLSEGFATYTEDIFQRITLESLLEELKNGPNMEMEKGKLKEALQELKLKSCIRLVTLQHELENTNSEQNLQVLQPNYFETGSVNNKVVNGLEPMKQFMQVHYLKGYFFLVHLSSLVGGESEFLKFLRCYVLKFKGQLVSSVDFLNFFKTQFCTVDNSSTLSCSSIDSLAREWLQNAALPEPYKSVHLNKPTMIISKETKNIFPSCIDQLMKINHSTLWFNSQMADNLEKNDYVQVNATEKLLFLEQVIESNERLENNAILYLERVIEPHTGNPELCHRWCELIIKYKCLNRIKTLKEFLLNHPAMGIYLYGEMMISEKRSFQKLAKELYAIRKNVMDPPSAHVLKQMII